MICFPGILLVTLALIIPGLHGQCINCEKLWKSSCHAEKTGYFCEKGADIVTKELTRSQLATSTPDPHNLYATCVPYPLHLEYVYSWCCFWSKELGCQVAVHPTKYVYDFPGHFCELCRYKCMCKMRNIKVKMRPWNWSYLGGISIILVRFL